jgi:hypothetical protein
MATEIRNAIPVVEDLRIQGETVYPPIVHAACNSLCDHLWIR